MIAAKDALKKETASQFQTRSGSQRKKDKEVTEVLEQLLFHLQTDPNYMADLLLGSRFQIKESTAAENDKQWDVVARALAPVFGSASDTREEFLLVRVLGELLLRDIESLTSTDKFGSSLPSIRFIARAFADSLVFF